MGYTPYQYQTPKLNTPYLMKAGQSLGNLLGQWGKTGDLGKAFTSPSFLGDVFGTGGQFAGGTLGGIGGKALGYTLSDIMKGGSGFSWATSPDMVAGFLPGLIGLANPKAGKIASAAYSTGNLLSNMIAGKSLPSLIGGKLGLGGAAGGAATMFPTAAPLTALGAEAAGGAGAGLAGGLGGGLMAMAPLLGPLGILGAMIGVGQLLIGDRRSPWEANKQKIYQSLDYLRQYANNPSSLNPQQTKFVENKLGQALKSGQGFYGAWGGTKAQGLYDMMKANNASSWADMVKLAETDPELRNYVNVMTKRMANEAPMTSLLFGANDPYSILSGGGTMTPELWSSILQKYPYSFVQSPSYVEPSG